MRRRKRYVGDEHTTAYDLEAGVFDRDKNDPDYDVRDLARSPHYEGGRGLVPAQDEANPLTQLDPRDPFSSAFVPVLSPGSEDLNQFNT